MAHRGALSVLLTILAVLLVADPAPAQTPKRGGVIRIAEREAPGARSPPDDQLPHALLREPGLQPARPVPQRPGAEVARPTSRSCPTWPRSGRSPRTARSTRSISGKGVRFHNKPPVNGREVTAEDVKYSLERFMAKSGFRERFEPVQAIDVVDRHTVRITLKEAVRAVPQSPREPELLRDPAARGRGQVQGLQPSRRGDRHRPLRAQVVRQGRQDRLRAESRLLHEGLPLSRRGRHRDHARRGRAPVRAAGGQGRAAARLGLDQPGGGTLAQADEAGDES